MNKAQENYWNGMNLQNTVRVSWHDAQEMNRAAALTIADQDEQIERLARRLADAELELTQTLRIHQAEQKAYLKLMNRICDALGSWVGPWDDAAIAAIKKSRKQCVPSFSLKVTLKSKRWPSTCSSSDLSRSRTLPVEWVSLPNGPTSASRECQPLER